jgi:hypothetical protein
MTLREAERRAQQRRRSDPAHDREVGLNQHQVLTFREWCLLNKISPATGRRILASGQGPTVTRLSARRIGITVGNNAVWQQSRAQPA